MNVSAAAMKSKLFADQEEREVQRLAATVINHQVSMCFAIWFACTEDFSWTNQDEALLGPTGSGLPGGSSTLPSNPAGMSPRPLQGRCKILAPVKINLYFEHDLISYVSLSTFFIESSKGACWQFGQLIQHIPKSMSNILWEISRCQVTHRSSCGWLKWRE